MASEWENFQLKDVGVTLLDCVHKTPPDAGEGVPYIAIPQMKEGRIDFSANPRLISNEHYVEWTKKAKPQHNDIILSRRCNPGETAYVPPEVEFALGQNLVLLRSDGLKVHSSFLRWLVRGRSWWEQVGKFLNVGAVFDSLKCVEIPKFELPIPPLPEQKAIAHVLGALDDRIELNRRMNETLEAMAQALFKSWFVDFDPVIDNALASGKEIPAELSDRAKARAALGDKRQPLPEEIRTLFPNEFTDSAELGWIPKGWAVGCLEDMVTLQRGFDLPKTKRTKGSFPLIAASGQDGTHNEAKVVGPGVVTGRSGKIGIVNFVQENFWPLNTTLWVKKYKNSTPYHAYQLLSTLGFERYNSGSAVPTLNRNHVHGMRLLVPPMLIIREFSHHSKAMFEKINENQKQVKSLASLRDTLLPKLLSGELRIPDAEKLVEELAL
jgi:type I restriction enzyme, S subunit